MKRVLPPLLTLLLFGFLQGCAPKKMPPVHTYTLALTTPLPARHGGPPPLASLRLAMVGDSRLNEGTAIYYRLGDYTMQPYAFSRWVEPPNRMLEAKLLWALQRSGLVRHVVVTGEAPYRLEIDLLTLVQRFQSPTKSRAVLVASATLRQKGRPEPVATRLFQISLPAPTPDASGGVIAFNEAADRFVLALQAWLATALSPDPKSPPTEQSGE